MVNKHPQETKIPSFHFRTDPWLDRAMYKMFAVSNPMHLTSLEMCVYVCTPHTHSGMCLRKQRFMQHPIWPNLAIIWSRSLSKINTLNWDVQKLTHHQPVVQIAAALHPWKDWNISCSCTNWSISNWVPSRGDLMENNQIACLQLLQGCPINFPLLDRTTTHLTSYPSVPIPRGNTAEPSHKT